MEHRDQAILRTQGVQVTWRPRRGGVERLLNPATVSASEERGKATHEFEVRRLVLTEPHRG